MTVPPLQFKSQSELIDYLSSLEQRVNELESENQYQKQTITDLAQEQQALATRPAPAAAVVQQPRLPDTNLLSHSYLTRAFAVFGHYFVASLVVAIIMMAVWLVIFLIAMALGIGISPAIFGQ